MRGQHWRKCPINLVEGLKGRLQGGWPQVGDEADVRQVYGSRVESNDRVRFH